MRAIPDDGDDVVHVPIRRVGQPAADAADTLITLPHVLVRELLNLKATQPGASTSGVHAPRHADSVRVRCAQLSVRLQGFRAVALRILLAFPPIHRAHLLGIRRTPRLRCRLLTLSTVLRSLARNPLAMSMNESQRLALDPPSRWDRRLRQRGQLAAPALAGCGHAIWPCLGRCASGMPPDEPHRQPLDLPASFLGLRCQLGRLAAAASAERHDHHQSRIRSSSRSRLDQRSSWNFANDSNVMLSPSPRASRISSQPGRRSLFSCVSMGALITCGPRPRTLQRREGTFVNQHRVYRQVTSKTEGRSTSRLSISPTGPTACLRRASCTAPR